MCFFKQKMPKTKSWDPERVFGKPSLLPPGNDLPTNKDVFNCIRKLGENKDKQNTINTSAGKREIVKKVTSMVRNKWIARGLKVRDDLDCLYVKIDRIYEQGKKLKSGGPNSKKKKGNAQEAPLREKNNEPLKKNAHTKN